MLLVLAAGSSTRMGQNKLLLDMAGRKLVRHVVENAIDAGVGPVLVVLGHEAERVQAELTGLGCQTLLNANHAHGQRTSLQAGVASAAPDTRAIGVLLADMPFVTPAMIRGVVERYRSSSAPLVVSRYGDVTAPPIVYDRALFAELLALSEPQCAKAVIRRHRDEAESVAWPDSALRDIDVPEDYARALSEPGIG
jgi:molybdenum cofactor cytidylyltransferase